MVARANVAAHPFDLIGIDVGHCSLNRCGQIEDQWFCGRWLQHVHHRFAHLKAEFEFSRREGFRAIFKMPIGLRIFGRLLFQDIGALDSNRLHARFVEVEDDVAPCWANRIIDMHNCTRRAGHALERFFNQIAPGLCQALNCHVIRNAPAVDQPTNKIKVGGARAWEANLNLFHADFQQQIKKAFLLLRPHWVNKRLVSVTQVGGKPTRRTIYGSRRPDTVGQIHLGKRSVFTRWVGKHHDNWQLR